MRLVDFEQFCRMPAGTIFIPYEPCVALEELAIKVDEGFDELYNSKYFSHYFNGVMPLTPDISESSGLWNVGDSVEASFYIYDGSSADYMEYKLFLVFDNNDIDKMINVLKWAKGGCKGDI